MGDSYENTDFAVWPASSPREGDVFSSSVVPVATGMGDCSQALRMTFAVGLKMRLPCPQ
jgi:hypothetical protein